MAIIKTTLAKDDDNGNTVYIYPKSTADIIEYDENTSVKDKLDELGAEDITIDKLPEGIKKSNTAAVSIGAVNAMLKVAESYFNQCYTPSGEEPGITYQSHTGLYSSNTKTGDGVKAINCSQFVNALLTGVSYENSRYVNDKNTAYNWGIRFDDSNPELFGSTAEDDNVEIANRYLTSQNLAKYAYEHGYLHMIKDNDGCDFKIRPGDIIFSGDDSSSDRYLGIGHVEFVLNVGNEISSYNKSSNTSEKPVYSRIESYAGVSKVDLDGTSHDTAGLRLYGENNITSAKRNICVARFPIGDVAYIPEMIDTVSNIAASAITDPVIYTFSTVAEQGFYTIVFHGKAGVNPYISSVYTNGSGSTYHRPMLHVDDNTYYATIYNQYPGKIQVKMAVSTSGTLNAESKRYYDVEEVTLYKGYADPSMRVIPHAYGIDDLSDALKTSNITISSGTVNAMLDVAEGYFNYSYLDYQTSDSDEIYHGFAYDNNKGLYKSETKYDDTYNNRYAISNAQFVDAVLNGIAFRNSRYKNDNNAAYTWGIKFDNTAVLGTTNSTDGAEISNRYVTAQNLARYAHDHGYLYKIDENANIRPGDVVFFGTSSDNYLGINQVSIVVNVSTTHLSVIECVAESMKTNADGSQSPVALRINKRSISYFTYGAAFPLGNIDNNIDLIESVFNLQVDTENNDEYTSMHSFSKLLDRGFYTVIMHGVYPTKPYVVLHYNNYEEAVSQGSMHKFGNDYYLTFYVQEPGTVSIVVANNGETYTADDASLYRGYADILTTIDNNKNRIFTPQLFGFKNNGTARDAEIFQMAVNYAANHNRTLYISSAINLVNTINLPQSFRLVGFNGNAGQCAITSTAPSVFKIEDGATNISLENLRIDGNGTNSLFNNDILEGLHLFNCNCKNFNILFKNCTSHNMVISNLDATEINGVFSGHFNNSRIIGGYINFKTDNTNGQQLISLTDSSMFTLKDVFFTGSTIDYDHQPDYCLNLSSCFGFTVDNCVIDYFKRGIVMNSCTNYTFSNNSIRGCGTQEVVSIVYMSKCSDASFIYNNYLPTHKSTIEQRNASSRTLRMVNCTSITVNGNKYSADNPDNTQEE